MTEFEKYFKSLQSQKISDITEHSHRPALKELLESLVSANVKVLHEPKREGKFGSPDFKITHTESIIGYIENKKIEENLDKIIKSDQIKKYQALSDNILITNYIDWIWIKGSETQKRETLCFLNDIENKKAKLDKHKVEAVEKLIKSFLSQPPKEIADAKKLAEELAIRAKLLKDFLLDELKRQQEENTDGRLFQLYETFRSFVFHELSISEFSDAFAQTLVYGLFLAKLNADTNTVNLYNAKKYIPASFDLIKELVNFLDELDNDEYREARWIVEEVLTIMNNLDLGAIQDSLSFTKKQKDLDSIAIKDPYVYFYENFLAAYDKKLRKAKGVYYTPPPVVNFIVRAIDDILKDTFNIKDGLADKNKVTILDFATGTGTFLVEILQQIFEKLPKDSGKKDLIIKEHVLKNIFGFEYLIAPYTIAHLKLSQFLKDNGYTLKAKERLQVYLTNTLEPIPVQIKIPLLPALTEESKQAQQVKDKPILVITGNPPYSGHSKNNGEWIKEKIKDYYFVDGKSLGEKNSKWLQDDYVKFIRFAQDKMETVEEGVVGIITNHRFLTNPTFRGMRQSLMKTFDQIYLIDLHGSNKPKEFAPDGGKDENVFDIEQGVAISLFIKKIGIERKIFHTDFWGTRLEKYQRSLEDDLKSIAWEEVKATAPFYLLKPQDEKLKSNYFKFQSLNDIFIKNSLGIFTHRDFFLVDTDSQILNSRIQKFKKAETPIEIKKEFKLTDTRDWKIDSALKTIKKSVISIEPYQYRPFDTRLLCYNLEMFDRGCSRYELMQAFLKRKNIIGLVTGRAGQNVTPHLDWNLISVTKDLTDANLFSRGGATVFPAYISRSNLIEKEATLISNIKSEFLKALSYIITNEELVGYIYAILHSPTYRSKYSEFLKIDFPRIPFTEDKDVFQQLAGLGNELINVHLLKTIPDYPYAVYLGKGADIVENPNFVVENGTGTLWINKLKRYENVPPEVYDFYIGGYKVLEHYLKDRKGRELSSAEIENIENTVKAIAFTIAQMKKINELTESWI